MTASRRRWSFTLRTLFVVVTVFACWLGYYIRWKGERREARAWIEAHGVGGSIGYTPEPRPALPWMLKLLGEKPEHVVIMAYSPSLRYQEDAPREYRWLVNRVASLFPEAQVVDLSEDR